MKIVPAAKAIQERKTKTLVPSFSRRVGTGWAFFTTGNSETSEKTNRRLRWLVQI